MKTTGPLELRQWRRSGRSDSLAYALEATRSLQWSRELFEFLSDELYVTEALESLLGTPLRLLDETTYPQAIALALLLKHSWQPEDLAYALERLGLATPPPARG